MIHPHSCVVCTVYFSAYVMDSYVFTWCDTVTESWPGGCRTHHHSGAWKGHWLLKALHDPRHQHHVPCPPGELRPKPALPTIISSHQRTHSKWSNCLLYSLRTYHSRLSAMSNGLKRTTLPFWPMQSISLSLSKSLHKLCCSAPYHPLYLSAVFSSCFPPLLPSLIIVCLCIENFSSNMHKERFKGRNPYMHTKLSMKGIEREITNS